jgi:hypothetical protein
MVREQEDERAAASEAVSIFNSGTGDNSKVSRMSLGRSGRTRTTTGGKDDDAVRGREENTRRGAARTQEETTRIVMFGPGLAWKPGLGLQIS